jgi:uncharacterized protein (TIGR02147 family)
MGFRCHSSLVLLLNGNRKIRPEHFDRLNRGLKLSGDEEAYFRTLVHFRAASSEKEKSHFEARLKLLSPDREQTLLDTERFRSIADWIHMAILEMTELKDFEPNSCWIAKRLKNKVKEEEVTSAIDRLLQLGLLEWRDGYLVKTNANLTTPRDRASECIREHHRQVLRNAITAIDEQDVSERVLNSSTLTIDVSRLPEAKELILKFREDMGKLLEKRNGDETYQLSVQLFKLTESGEQK